MTDREQAGKEEQAQVLYKKTTFEKVSTSTQNAIIDNILEEMFPANQTAYQKISALAKKQIRERICVVHLRHKRTEREIIFISYHNILKGEGGDLGICKTRVSSVCQIIAKIHESSKCCVIAGADLNCKNFDRTNVTVSVYKATPGREKISKVDFFILPKKSTEKWTVEAFDIFPQERRAPFYIELRSLLNYHVEGEYKKAFDHDPLTLSLKIDWGGLVCKNWMCFKILKKLYYSFSWSPGATREACRQDGWCLTFYHQCFSERHRLR